MDLWPENMKEQLDEAFEFAKALKNKGLLSDNFEFQTVDGNLAVYDKTK